MCCLHFGIGGKCSLSTLIISILTRLCTGPATLTAFDALLLFLSLCHHFFHLMETFGFVWKMRGWGAEGCLLFWIFIVNLILSRRSSFVWACVFEHLVTLGYFLTVTIILLVHTLKRIMQNVEWKPFQKNYFIITASVFSFFFFWGSIFPKRQAIVSKMQKLQ